MYVKILLKKFILYKYRKTNMKKFNEIEVDGDVLKFLNEMSVEQADLKRRCHSMSDIYAEHIQKILYFGDVSTSWRDSIWKSVCYIPKRVFADTKSCRMKNLL